jgi:hypothetical protein
MAKTKQTARFRLTAEQKAYQDTLPTQAQKDAYFQSVKNRTEAESHAKTVAERKAEKAAKKAKKAAAAASPPRGPPPKQWLMNDDIADINRLRTQKARKEEERRMIALRKRQHYDKIEKELFKHKLLTPFDKERVGTIADRETRIGVIRDLLADRRAEKELAKEAAERKIAEEKEKEKARKAEERERERREALKTATTNRSRLQAGRIHRAKEAAAEEKRVDEEKVPVYIRKRMTKHPRWDDNALGVFDGINMNDLDDSEEERVIPKRSSRLLTKEDFAFLRGIKDTTRYRIEKSRLIKEHKKAAAIEQELEAVEEKHGGAGGSGDPTTPPRKKRKVTHAPPVNLDDESESEDEYDRPDPEPTPQGEEEEESEEGEDIQSEGGDELDEKHSGGEEEGEEDPDWDPDDNADPDSDSEPSDNPPHLDCPPDSNKPVKIQYKKRGVKVKAYTRKYKWISYCRKKRGSDRTSRRYDAHGVARIFHRRGPDRIPGARKERSDAGRSHKWTKSKSSFGPRGKYNTAAKKALAAAAAAADVGE